MQAEVEEEEITTTAILKSDFRYQNTVLTRCFLFYDWYINDTFEIRKMEKSKINTAEFRSLCPVATGLDILGDKWTLLILRDMIWGHKSLFSEFKESPEHMPSKMLSNRLKKLEEFGFISKKAGITNKKNVYYLMEDKGIDAFPIMIEMAIFTSKHFFDYLGTTYTKESRGVMIKNKKEYIADMVKQYKKFKKGITI
jgi:DNA-binding HxlR family transcriptional regulator